MELTFNTEMDADAQLEEMQREVESLQEDFQLKALQDTAAKEEGTRKSTGTAAAAAGAKGANTSIFVGGMDPRTTEADLRVFFASCGTITRMTILKDRTTSVPKGTAYIEFESHEQATAAIVKDGQSLHGRPLKVAPKRENIPASQRGGRGGPMMNGGFYQGGRGGRGGMAPQMAAMAMMASMMGSMGYSPYGGAPRGRGGRGRGRGSH